MWTERHRQGKTEINYTDCHGFRFGETAETLLPVTTSLTATNRRPCHLKDRVTRKQQYCTATVPQGSSALAMQRADFSLVLSICNLQFCFNHFSFNVLWSVSGTCVISEFLHTVCFLFKNSAHQTSTCSQNWRNHSMGNASEALRRCLMWWSE
jgi:hypothetical protein